MTALLRSGDARTVETYAGPTRPRVAAPDPLEAECAALRAEIAQLREAAARSTAQHAKALETARDQGRAEGQERAEKREAERLAMLEAELARACTLFARKLDHTERFAAELASVAIERVVAAPSALSGLTAAFVATQVEALRDASILRAQVSAADFPDESALAGLASKLAEQGSGIEVVRDAAMASGSVRFGCKLGEAAADLRGQFTTLAALLRDLAGP
jgi:flagellar biosynthesis/type III secretory pathway protein FliH